MVKLLVLLLQVTMNISHDPIQGALKLVLVKVLFKVCNTEQEGRHRHKAYERPFFSSVHTVGATASG